MNIQDTNSVEAAKHISVIVPVLNEQENLPKLLDQLRHFSFGQVIIVDGGSSDNSWQWLEQMHEQLKEQHQKNANELALNIVQSDSGRAKQMNAGATLATKEYLLFLHADSELPQNAASVIEQSLAQKVWGRFDVAFKEPDWRMPIIAWCMNWRSRLSGIATGDQAIFVRRTVFEQLHGYATIPLMEDVELSKRLLNIGKPACSDIKVLTSARRWLNRGVLRTVFLMWRLRWSFFMGTDPQQLANKYHQVR